MYSLFVERPLPGRPVRCEERPLWVAGTVCRVAAVNGCSAA